MSKRNGKKRRKSKNVEESKFSEEQVYQKGGYRYGYKRFAVRDKKIAKFLRANGVSAKLLNAALAIK